MRLNETPRRAAVGGGPEAKGKNKLPIDLPKSG